jgi:predicted transcriptional regulator
MDECCNPDYEYRTEALNRLSPEGIIKQFEDMLKDAKYAYEFEKKKVEYIENIVSKLKS